VRRGALAGAVERRRACNATPIAVAVKRADLADNTDPARLAVLDEDTRRRLESKYARARGLLGTS